MDEQIGDCIPAGQGIMAPVVKRKFGEFIMNHILPWDIFTWDQMDDLADVKGERSSFIGGAAGDP